jgi:hypothetical protein
LPRKLDNTAAAVNIRVSKSAGDSGPTLTWDGEDYTYNWKTSGNNAGSYWRLGAVFDDSQTYYVTIGVR